MEISSRSRLLMEVSAVSILRPLQPNAVVATVRRVGYGRSFSSSSRSKPLSLRPHHPPISIPSASFTPSELQHLIQSVNQSPAMPRRPLPILSIGAGNITQVAHLPSYQQAGFEVRGLTDVSLDTARQTAKQFNIPAVYSSVQEMVGRHKGEKVVFDIAVPAVAILDILKQLPPDCYALIQKPMGDNLIQARAIRDLCRERRIGAAINFQLRTAPYIIAMKEMIRRGVIGEITGIDFRVNVFTPWSKWPFIQAAPHMELIYHSIHYIDLMRDLYGEPQRLHCMTYTDAATPRSDNARSNLLFLYRPDVQTTIHTNHTHRWGHQHAESYVKVEGKQGAIVAKMGVNIQYPRNDLDSLQVSTDELKGRWLDVPLKGSWFPEAFKGPMANVMRFAGGEIEAIPTGLDDAYKTMAVIDAAAKSAQHLTPVVYD